VNQPFFIVPTKSTNTFHQARQTRLIDVPPLRFFIQDFVFSYITFDDLHHIGLTSMFKLLQGQAYSCKSETRRELLKIYDV
jgi:hypothetical protein